MNRPTVNRLAPYLLRTFCLALSGLILTPGGACAQPGLDLESDTLTQSVLVHQPIDAPGRRADLSTREHTYRPQLRLVDQLGRDFTVMKV